MSEPMAHTSEHTVSRNQAPKKRVSETVSVAAILFFRAVLGVALWPQIAGSLPSRCRGRRRA